MVVELNGVVTDKRYLSATRRIILRLVFL